MNFSKELNKYIDMLDCSAKDICEVSGLSPALVSRYLNNKRTPKADSLYLDKLIDAIYIIAKEKNINISKASIERNLSSTIKLSNIDYDVFIDNLNLLQDTLKISTVELSKVLDYDASFLSRIKNKERKPADLENFISVLTDYIVSSYSSIEKKEKIASLFKCPVDNITTNEQYKEEFSKWISTVHSNINQDVYNFLSKLDDFNLKDYIGKDLEKVKVPSSPVIFKHSKTYFGIEGRKQAEGDFLKTTLLSKSSEPIFFYSDLPLAESAKDESFKQKWVVAMTMLLKKGLHLNMVHNINRPVAEMLLGLESWIPIYMTGSITPYYFKNPPSNFFTGSHCTSGVVALSSECIRDNEKNSKFYLTTRKEEIEFEKEKSKYMLSKASPLMEIYRETDIDRFKEFMKKTPCNKIQTIKKNTFKNIDFCINENEWIMINKKISPKIHFVIYNENLMEALKTFLLD